MSNQNAGIYPQKMQSKWDVMEFGVSQLLSSSFRLPLFILPLPFPLFLFLFVPLSFREVPISWGAGSQKTKNEANIFHSTNFPSSLQNFYRIESFIYSHWQRLCTLLQKCPDDNSSGLNSIWFEPAWVRLKKLVQ